MAQNLDGKGRPVVGDTAPLEGDGKAEPKKAEPGGAIGRIDGEEMETEEPHTLLASVFAHAKPKPKKFHIIRTTRFLDALDGSRKFEITANSVQEVVEFAIINVDGSHSCVTIPWDEAGSIVSALFI